jgi:shikimate kinase/3-dehydroquinate synthase
LLAHRRPVTMPGGIVVDAILAATMRDKKRTGAHVPFVLVDEPGELRVGCEVALDELRAAVGELRD